MVSFFTAAYNRDTSGDGILGGGSMKASDPFDIGAGQISPSQAMDPGLIYDMKIRDYVVFLCNGGYTWDQIKSIVIMTPEIPKNCPQPGFITNSNLNYPTITVSNLQCTTTINRTLRNVGKKKTAIYFVSILSPNGVDVKVWPRVAFFSPFKEEFTYHVTLKPKKLSQGRYDFGEIVWSDGLHFVRSPVVVSVNNIVGDQCGASAGMNGAVVAS